MRRQLVAGAAAVTATVVVAFLIPLAFLVRTIAADRAMDEAEFAARAVAPVVSVSTDPAVIEPALAAVGGQLRLSVYLPDGTVLGVPAPADDAVEAARAGRSLQTPTGESPNVVVPVVGRDGATTVVRAALPASALTQGVGRTWAMLAAVGIGLLAVAMFVADRLARTIVVPTAALAEVAGRLGAGELDARLTPAGPAEVRHVGVALNALAERIRVLLAAERELVADLSHRLRTPLTALRLDADAVAEPDDARRLRDDVDALEAEVDGIIRRARDPLQGSVGAQADLAEVVRSRAAFWAPLAEDQGRPWHV